MRLVRLCDYLDSALAWLVAGLALGLLFAGVQCDRSDHETDRLERVGADHGEGVASGGAAVDQSRGASGNGQAARPAQRDAHMQGRQVSCVVTAYCPCSKCCGKWADGITASGAPAVGKLVAADRSLAFGTMVEVPGYGVAPVLDRGGAINGNRLDVLFPDHQAALAWGRKTLTVTIYPSRAAGPLSPSVPDRS